MVSHRASIMPVHSMANPVLLVIDPARVAVPIPPLPSHNRAALNVILAWGTRILLRWQPKAKF